MRAITYREFGGPEVLTYTDDAPEPGVQADEVLVRVRATSVNPVDWKLRTYGAQASLPYITPIIPGWDVAGVVERTGGAVPEFAPGDEVIGYARKDFLQGGTSAELVAAPVRALALKPASVDFATAASLPLAGLTAHQVLDAVAVGEGDTVLVHAAAGGVGHLAVQLARLRGARVLGTASQANHDFLRNLGAEPLTYGDGLVERVRELVGGPVDAAVDLAGGIALDASFELVKDAGRVASVVDGPRAAERGGEFVYVRPNPPMLTALAQLVDAGDLRIEVAETFPLERLADAHRRQESGHVRGKIAVTV